MLGYRHAFHAGNFADVLKHAVYCFVLDHALRKAKPVYVLDTHAGAGRYDLTSPDAARTGEHQGGIARLFAGADAPPDLFRTYLGLVRAANPDGLRIYPGSPELARALLRQQDRLELAELHPTDHRLLDGRLGRLPRTRVARADGLALLLARMPPPERRAVVLIDPSYELKADFAAVVRALVRAHRRFATGTFIVWYPVVERERAEALMRALQLTRLRGLFRLELCPRRDAPGHGMTGAGLVVLNPPWTLPEAGEAGLAWLAGRLHADGPVACRWLVPPG